VIFDTALVTISRSRAGRPVLIGGRDHLTHRLASRLGRPRNVALALVGAQLTLCTITIAVARAGAGWVLLAGGATLVFGLVMIWQLEGATWLERLERHSEHVGLTPERASVGSERVGMGCKRLGLGSERVGLRSAPPKPEPSAAELQAEAAPLEPIGRGLGARLPELASRDVYQP
jgi:hypothetical protein